MAISRKDFLRMCGGIAGGAMFYSCFGDGSGDGAPVPSGYRYYPVARIGDTLPDGSLITEFNGSVKISDHNDILFIATDSNGKEGIHELTMNFSGSEPAVSGTRTIVRTGDTLNDGFVVDSMKLGSPNKLGYYATVLTSSDGEMGVYMEKDRLGLTPVARALDSIPGGKGNFGSNFGDIELDDTNSIILVSHYAPSDGSQPKEGLFFLCGGMVNDAGRLLVSSGDLLPESSTAVGRIGLVDICKESGEYVVQVNCGISVTQYSKSQKLTSTYIPSTALIGGSTVESSRSHRLFGASKNISVTKAASASALKGDIIYGPRIGGSNSVAQILHITDDTLSLNFNNREVVRDGDYSPLGNKIISFSGPAISDSGLLFFIAYTEEGEELCIFNGVKTGTVFCTGMAVSNQDPRTIVSITFGVVRNMIDKDGRIVFMGDLDDNSSIMFIGIPV